MSLATSIGSEQNLLEESPEHARVLRIEHPVLKREELERSVIVTTGRSSGNSHDVHNCGGVKSFREALERLQSAQPQSRVAPKC